MKRFLPQSVLSKMRFLGLIILICFICAACAPFSKEIMSQADESISVNDIQTGIDKFKGKKVIWGGVIVETENRQNETRILIMKTALDRQKRPVNLDRSEGRFILKHNDFLDPVIYSQGREITIIGEVVGKEDLPLGKVRYDYPVITANESVLWEKFDYYYPYYHDHYYHGPFWGVGLGWGWGWHRRIR